MQSLILTLHIIVCVLLVILILLQSGKEGMGVIFGGGNSSVFGSTGAGGILAKLTTLMAIIFIITSLSYTYVSSSRPKTDSVILDVQIDQPASQATRPAEPPKAPEEAPVASPPAEAGPAPTASEPAAQPEAPETPAADQAAPAEQPQAEQAKPQAE